MTLFRRNVSWRAAFDKRSTKPEKDYGIHGAELAFQLIGEEGGVELTIYTNWHLPHVRKELNAKIDRTYPHLFCQPQPAWINGHWHKPPYDGAYKSDDCKITGGVCYSNGSALLADTYFQVLVAEGDEALWKKLEELYYEWKPK